MMHGHEKSGPCHSSCEADEQSGAIRSGVGGAKGRDQGECALVKHALDSAPGLRGTRTGTHAATNFAVRTRGGSRMRESRTYGIWAGGAR